MASTFQIILRTLRERAYAKIRLLKPNETDRKWQKGVTILKTELVIAMESARIIKPVPTFELFNQFLVWVTQKILALSDLDLLLTEYYKERLKPQLKNKKKIYTTDQTSTELTRLRLPTN